MPDQPSATSPTPDSDFRMQSKGGHERARVLTPERRREISSAAANARWQGQEAQGKGDGGSAVGPLTFAKELRLFRAANGGWVLQDVAAPTAPGPHSHVFESAGSLARKLPALVGPVGAKAILKEFLKHSTLSTSP